MTRRKHIALPKAVLGIFLLIGTIMVFAGIKQILFAQREQSKGSDSLSWPQTEGVVLRCEHHYSPGGTYRSSHEYATISYRYVVDGQSHTSEQVTVANKKVFNDAESYTRNHPPGQKVDVYYDPKNPTDSVLLPGRDEIDSAWMWLGIGGILGGLLVANSSLREWRRACLPQKNVPPTPTLR